MLLSPRPGAILVRHVFERETRNAESKIAEFDPGNVTVIRDVNYRNGDPDAYLDVSFPEGTQDSAVLPTVVWTHGGAWISGAKDDYSVYHRMMAAEGFTVVSVGYSLGPEHRYPTPLIQVNAALAFLTDNASKYHVDKNRIVLAGDSAGAQISSQLTAMITDPQYAPLVGVMPQLAANQLRGAILYCGIFDIERFLSDDNVGPRILLWGATTAIWAYTGSKSSDSAAARQMSTLSQVGVNFPPTFISGGNGDPLTDHQSIPMARALQGEGVAVTGVFFPDDHDPALGHEYQFRVDLDDAMNTFNQMIDWLKEVTK